MSEIATSATRVIEGYEAMGAHNRLTWILRPSVTGLSIVHEHTSVPVGFEDQKGILQQPGKS